jgi:hypothetical protein
MYLRYQDSNAPKWLVYGAAITGMLAFCLGVAFLLHTKEKRRKRKPFVNPLSLISLVMSGYILGDVETLVFNILPCVVNVGTMFGMGLEW